jgi:hypothetical protein
MNKATSRFALLSLFTASVCFAQEPAREQTPGQASPPRAAQTNLQQDGAPQDQSKEMTVPSGTRIALTLTNAIRSQFAHRGDSVRAVTAFPVAVGNQVAIPSGTYVDGAIEKVTKRGGSGHGELQIHFTHMVFANGYAVLLDTASTLARAFPIGTPGPSVSADSTRAGAGVPGALSFQQPQPPPPTLTPPPRPGPNPAVVAGISLGATAALIITGIAFHHRHSGDILFEAGSQFEMVLASPLSLDANRVGAGASSGQ